MKTKLRSPFFYVGDKYKIMPQIVQYFPQKIENYYEPFLGGGSSILYVDAHNYFLNDIDYNVIQLHQMFNDYKFNKENLFLQLKSIIKEYGLSCSYYNHLVPDDLKKQYKKTYYAKYNKDSYLNLRHDYNQDKDILKLYILLIYGFNRILRFNSKGNFNVPVGNVDFNKNVANAIENYLNFLQNNNINFEVNDYADFLNQHEFSEGDFIYLDPPYLISNSHYNKQWSETADKQLFSILDELDEKGVKFGLSNIVTHKGKTNMTLKEWMSKYTVYDIKSNYISRFDNSIKLDSREVYITNYEKGRA